MRWSELALGALVGLKGVQAHSVIDPLVELRALQGMLSLSPRCSRMRPLTFLSREQALHLHRRLVRPGHHLHGIRVRELLRGARVLRLRPGGLRRRVPVRVRRVPGAGAAAVAVCGRGCARAASEAVGRAARVDGRVVRHQLDVPGVGEGRVLLARWVVRRG